MRKGKGFGIVIVSAIVIVGLSIFNLCKYKTEFLTISISSCLSLLVAIFVSYFLVQKRTDLNSQRDSYSKLLLKIQAIADEKEAYEISENTDINTLTMRKRNLNNYSRIMLEYSERFGLKTEAEFIDEKIKEYSTFMGNHLDDLPYLAKSSKELRRPLELIDAKIIEMLIKIYE